MKKLTKTVLLTVFACGFFSVSAAPVPLFNGAAPGAKGNNPKKDIPTIEYFPAADVSKPHPAVVIFPGGGYYYVTYKGEGTDFAAFLNKHGYSAFVVKYRVGPHGYKHPVMLQDGLRAMRYARYHAAKYNIMPDRIGVMGSSAGGHLASTVMTHFDYGKKDAADPIERVSSRPDFGILCYPVITMGKFTHPGTRKCLLGAKPSPEDMEFLSSEKQVKKETPPCFLWHTSNDKIVPVENSLFFAAALREHKIPFEMHVYPQGGHGMGLALRYFDWTDHMLKWLKKVTVKNIPNNNTKGSKK